MITELRLIITLYTDCQSCENTFATSRTLHKMTTIVLYVYVNMQLQASEAGISFSPTKCYNHVRESLVQYDSPNVNVLIATICRIIAVELRYIEN